MTESVSKVNSAGLPLDDSTLDFNKIEIKLSSPEPDKGMTVENSSIRTGDKIKPEPENPLIDPTDKFLEKRMLSVENIKKINREITKRIPPEDEEQLITERNSLVNKKFKKELSEQEERRLTFVRWQLDRIDDAKYGETLDFFETIIDEQEYLGYQLQDFLRQFKNR